jgi:drug/metabolite transporter (DMT)-like permease
LRSSAIRRSSASWSVERAIRCSAAIRLPVGPVLALAALAFAGTPLPFWLFAFGQARVPAERAGAFLNLEPVVGAAAGWLALGEPASLGQLMGIVAVLGGIALSTMPPSSTTERATVGLRLRRFAYEVLSFRT